MKRLLYVSVAKVAKIKCNYVAYFEIWIIKFNHPEIFNKKSIMSN